MKMSKVFGVCKIESHEDIVCDVGNYDLGTFNNAKQAEAAAHAINSHDKLEADKAALVEALEGLTNDIAINHSIHADNMVGGSTREALNQSARALKKVKGDL